MGVLQFPTALTGSVNVFPTYKYMVTTDNLSAVTTPGYLNVSNTDAAQPMARTDMVVGFYSYNMQTMSGTYGLFSVAVSNLGVITLSLLFPNISPITGWTPTIRFSVPGDLTTVYEQNFGTYFVNGNFVQLNFQLIFTPTYTTSSGIFEIFGQPYKNANLYAFGSVIQSSVVLNEGYTSTILGAPPTPPLDESLIIYQNGNGESLSILGTNNFPSGGTYLLYGSITFFI